MLDLGGEGSLFWRSEIYTHAQRKIFLKKKFKAANHCAYGNGYSVNCNPIPLQSLLEVHNHTCASQNLRSSPEPSTPLAPAQLLSHTTSPSPVICAPVSCRDLVPSPYTPTAITLHCSTSCVWRAACLNPLRADRPREGRQQNSAKLW